MNDSYVFYSSFHEAIKGLDDEQYGRIMRTISEYALTGTEPTNCTQIEHIVFALIKPQIDANNKRRDNGKFGALGGRPNQKEDVIEEKTQKTSGFQTKNPRVIEEKTQKTSGFQENNPNVNVNVNVNANEDVNANVNVNGDEEFLITSGCCCDNDSDIEKSCEEEQPQPPQQQCLDKLKSYNLFYDDVTTDQIVNYCTTLPDLIDFVVKKIGTLYANRPKDEQKRLFRKLIYAPDILFEYKNGIQIQKDRELAQQKKLEKSSIIFSPPTKCPTCGKELTSYRGNPCCESCGIFFFVDSKKQEWQTEELPQENQIEALKRTVGL